MQAPQPPFAFPGVVGPPYAAGSRWSTARAGLLVAAASNALSIVLSMLPFELMSGATGPLVEALVLAVGCVGVGLFASGPRESGARGLSIAAAVLLTVSMMALVGGELLAMALAKTAHGNLFPLASSMVGFAVFLELVATILIVVAAHRAARHVGAPLPVWIGAVAIVVVVLHFVVFTVRNVLFGIMDERLFSAARAMATTSHVLSIAGSVAVVALLGMTWNALRRA